MGFGNGSRMSKRIEIRGTEYGQLFWRVLVRRQFDKVIKEFFFQIHHWCDGPEDAPLRSLATRIMSSSCCWTSGSNTLFAPRSCSPGLFQTMRKYGGDQTLEVSSPSMAETFLDLSCNLILFLTTLFLGFPVSTSGKESACQCKSCRRHWVKKILWGREWQLPPVLLPGKSHGWRGLADYSPWTLKGGYNWTCMHTATLSS